MLKPARLILIFLILLIAGTFLAACKKEDGELKEARGPGAAKVKVETVDKSEIVESVNFVGKFDSRHSVNLYPKVTGHIKEIYVRPGETVSKGKLVIDLDLLKQEAAVDTKQSDVETAEADCQKEVAKLASLGAQREAQQAVLDYNQHEYTRNYWLEQRGVVSEATVDAFDRQYKVSKAKLVEIDQDIVAQKDVIQRAKRAIESAKNAKREQEEQLAYYRIRAPFAGIVGDIPVKLGDYVDTNTELTSINQLRPLELNVLIPKAVASQVKKGMSLEIVDENGKALSSCSIFHVDPVVDQQNQSVLVKALYENLDETYRPNQTVDARLILSKKKGISIPTEALSFIGGKAFAFVVDKAQTQAPVAKQRTLEIEQLENNRAVVKSGIDAGDQVVVSGVQNLSDGTPLAIE